MILENVKNAIMAVAAILSINVNNTSISIKNSNYIEEQPIMVLSIPKLNIVNNVYSFDSKLNDIDKNVQIMIHSDLPNKEKGNVILGGHSGSGIYAYFKDFDKLENNDDIYLEMNGNKYHYRIVNIYNDSKDGSIVVSHNDLVSRITLFTCRPNDKSNYLVVSGELV